MDKKLVSNITNNSLQNEDKQNNAMELSIANKKLAFQLIEREKQADELQITSTELAFQLIEKEKRASELMIANIELAYQNQEKEKRADELVIANKELGFQNKEKEKRAAELLIANKELAYQNQEKENRADELVIANRELEYQNKEKEKRAAELLIANKELAFQNKEKEKRAAELFIANKELAYQNQEKEKRADELVIANKELEFQNNEKEKRADELIIANKELAYQNQEKEKRADELVIALKELAYQNIEKEKRADELVIANKELEFQNNEKEKRANELDIANKELESFTFISSHDLQEPLRKIQTFSSRILSEEYDNLSKKGIHYFERMQYSALHMQTLINDLIAYSRTIKTEKKYENRELKKIVSDVIITLDKELKKNNATIEIQHNCELKIIKFQFHQLILNLISNSIKFCKPGVNPHIIIKGVFVKYNASNSDKFKLKKDHYHISVNDNGIGFDPQFKHKIFEIFQRLHEKNQYIGTGLGLTIVRKIVENHNGIIIATSEVNKGAQFDIYIPNN
jgi:signal transduction histidine kinase